MQFALPTAPLTWQEARLKSHGSIVQGWSSSQSRQAALCLEKFLYLSRDTIQMLDFRHSFRKWVGQLQGLQLPPASETKHKTETLEEGF